MQIFVDNFLCTDLMFSSLYSMSSEESTGSVETTQTASSASMPEQVKESLQRYRKIMYDSIKTANRSAADAEIKDYKKYSIFENVKGVEFFEDDSEDNDIDEDFELLGL